CDRDLRHLATPAESKEHGRTSGCLIQSRLGKFFTGHCTREALSMSDTKSSLYARLGGYDAIAAVVDDLQLRLENDPVLGRYWSARRSVATDRRVRQFTIDYIAAAAGGPTF